MHTPRDIIGARLSNEDKRYVSAWVDWVDTKLQDFRYERRKPEADGTMIVRLTANNIPVNKHIVNAIATLYRRHDWKVDHEVQENKTRRPTHILKFLPPERLNEDETVILIDTHRLEQLQSLAESRRGYVYLLRAENNLYKIGRSKSPKIRVSQITKAIAPFKIEVINVAYYEDHLRAEAELHAMFKSRRKQGEWFELAAYEVKQVIEHSYKPC